MREKREHKLKLKPECFNVVRIVFFALYAEDAGNFWKEKYVP